MNSTTGHWVDVNHSHRDYDILHSVGSRSKYHSNSEEIIFLEKFDKIFALTAEIDASCAAILRVKFFHNLKKYDDTLEKLRKLKKCDGKFPKTQTTEEG